MSQTRPDSPAWAAVLPPGTGWQDSRRRRTGAEGGGPIPGPPGRHVAEIAPPWSLAGTGADADPSGPRSYVALPSDLAPILIASRDRAVLRYVAGSVMSVPPGAGTAASVVLTAGLRVLRFRLAWNLLACARAVRLVVVERST